MKNVIATIALTIASAAAMATEVPNPGQLDQIVNPQGSVSETSTLSFAGVNCANIHSLESFVIFADGSVGEQAEDLVSTYCADLEARKMQATIAFQQLTTALHEITFSSATINRTEAASRASYLPLFDTYNNLLAERDDVLTMLVQVNADVQSSRGAWENEQAEARAGVAADRAYQMARIEDATIVRGMRPIVPRNQCVGREVFAQFQSTPECYAAWDAFFQARGDYYGQYGGGMNLLGHIAAAQAVLDSTDENHEVEAIVQATPAVQEALSRYQDAIAVQAADSSMARLTQIDSVQLPAALAALMAHPYFN